MPSRARQAVKNLGRFEKIAWSVPIDLDGRAFLIEHRKFGLGVFVEKLSDDEAPAAEIVRLITKAVKVAPPYFQWRGNRAAAASELNVYNRSRELHDRFRYFVVAAAAKKAEARTKFRVAHLNKVVNAFTRAGYLTAVRARSGGLRLAKPAEQIGLGNVIRTTEPDFALVECFSTGNQCVITKCCKLQGVQWPRQRLSPASTRAVQIGR